LSPTITGSGTITSWAISPSVPSGLSFSASTGVLSGTPTELLTRAMYTITATNSGGTATAYINITIVDEVPTIAYSPNDLTMTNNTASSDLPLSPTVTGSGEIVSWAISPSVPSGLVFSTSTGVLSGTPTELLTRSMFTITATNTGGSATAYINITVVDELPTIAYSPNDLSMTNNTASSDLPLVPTITGSGEITSWEINASLPSGLTFETSNGTIWGTPTELWTQTAYMVWANNTGGSAVAYLNITVVDQVPSSVSYSPVDLTLTNNTASSDLPLVPTITGSGEITSWEINATLPAGLTFETSNGTIWGTPSELWTQTAYTVWANNTGGSAAAYLNITVVDQVPSSVSYSPADLTLTNNTASSDLPLSPTITGSGEITSWEINASLPSGLTFETSNGTIWGTPTELWTQTAYTVWANNTGGSAVAYLNITVNDQMPTLSYSPDNLTLYKNTASSDLPLNATLTGPGEITSWAIAPDLPNGLTFETSNGTIWGIPTQRMTTTQFTVWANNTGGSAVAYLNITVLHEAPMFTYSSYNLTLVNNTAMSSMSTLITGGDITSWEVEPAFPTGLNLGSLYGTIWGTPTVVQNMTMYQIWANNSGGSHSVFINITIYDPVVDLQYNPENLTLIRDVTMSNLDPIYSGIVDDWTIVPGLPSGLVFTDGVISGTPDINMTRTMYTVWANNSGGSSSHTINITILEPMVTLDYNPENMTLVRGTQMAEMVPAVSGGTVEFWAIHPALPSGLLFDNGTVSGTPTVNMTVTMFTVYANNTGGNASHTINLTILEPAGDLSYTNVTLTRNMSMSPLSPTYSGGAVEVWSIHPTLPNGLNFSNGVISGTPLVNMTNSMFTVYANNSGGVASATVNITILEPAVSLSYNPDNLTLVRGTTMTPLEPTVTGGNVSEWGIMPDLPSGLAFANGVFFGTPDENMTQMQFTVYANTSGGEAIAWVNITILEPAVNLSYNPYNVTLVRNASMTPLSPTVSGGNAESWAIEPALPAGLLFDNGTISGTPEVNMTTTMFTVWANTSGGPASATINITIVEPPVSFVYDPAEITLTRNETMNATSPTLINDAKADQWSISPALPAGMNFSNGVISGTPEVNMTATQFTIYANNSGGSSAAFLTITILEPVATVVYVPENITLIRGEDNASFVPILGGGMVESWSIAPALPEGMVFENGSITGIPLVNSTNTTYIVTATNTGGSAIAYLNLTVVEPIAVISFNESFVITRGEDVLNATVNNTGGMVAVWAIEPNLPLGVTMMHGVLFGVSEVNTTVTTYTLWANNSGGSASLSFTLEVLEPKAEVEYAEDGLTLINGISHGLIVPVIEGGMPETWSIEPPLPAGLTFVNGYIIGTPTTNLNETTFTVYANNSGGTETATFTLTVEQPVYISRYPKTLLVLGVNQTMSPISPLFYFDEGRIPAWTIAPQLPAGLLFENGTISGTPTEASNFTNYTITVTGQMVPVNLHLSIEVVGAPNLTIESSRNETIEEELFVIPDFEEVDNSFSMFWICPPILAMIAILLSLTLSRLLERDEENAPEGEGKDEESEGDEQETEG
ncbi:putative Ig domain-containing protein, partial [Candidatus Poseidonia alphae]|nr:putative Ig domain-containing protein [Candidatus Poseidonia alphae]